MLNLNSDLTTLVPQRSKPVKSYASTTLKRLLVVDDNEDIHMLLEDRLESMGYLALRANNGVEALNVLAVIPVAGVLLDLEMPVMDGLTFLREFQQSHISVPIIVMSAGKDVDKFLEAIQLGAMDYLKKPIDIMLLRQKCFRIFV